MTQIPGWPRALKPSLAAAYIGRSESELHRLRRDDKTFPKPFQLRKGGEPIFDRNDLDRWLDSKKAEAENAERAERLEAQDEAEAEARRTAEARRLLRGA